VVDLDERLKRLWSYFSQIDDDDGVNGSCDDDKHE
jgi:hypothetical protein